MSVEEIVSRLKEINLDNQECVITISDNRYLIHTKNNSIYEYAVDKDGNYSFIKISGDE